MSDGTEIVPMLDSQLAEYLLYHEQMASRSYLFALGPFTPTVQDHLEYPGTDYEGTVEGTLVATKVFNCISTSQSTDMAIALGIDPDDFNTHMVQMSGVDIAALKDMFDGDEMMRFITLATNSFNFMFMPDK